MRLFEIVCSIDGDQIDYVETVRAYEKPGFWDCYEIAAAHGCEFFHLEELAPAAC